MFGSASLHEILHLPPHTLGWKVFPSVQLLPMTELRGTDVPRGKEPCAILLCSRNILASS